MNIRYRCFIRYCFVSSHTAVVALLVIFAFSSLGRAEQKTLVIPDVAISGYVAELLETSFREMGVDLLVLKSDPKISMARLELLAEKENGIDLIWRGYSRTIADRFLMVETDILNGLKGKRVLLVRPQDFDAYEHVRTIDDFRELKTVGGMGTGWVDEEIWEYNGLAISTSLGSWDPEIFHKLINGNRGVDYFARAAPEAIIESRSYTQLRIEPNLLLDYSDGFHIYVSKQKWELHRLLAEALELAEESGLIAGLVRKHFPEVYSDNGLNIESRTRIILSKPEPTQAAGDPISQTQH